MRDFELVTPSSVAEACGLLAEDPDGSAVFAGGTDILVYLKAGEKHHRRLVSLQNIDELAQIVVGHEGGLEIGAMVTVNKVARHEGIGRRFPGLRDAALSLAAEQVRNQATVVGNLCMAVPSADMAPILLAHRATLRVASPEGERRIPLARFFVGPRQHVLQPSDVVVAIELPPPPAGSGAASIRQGGRISLSLPIVSAAAVLQMDGPVCRAATVALGAVAPTPLVADEAGDSLVGNELDRDALEHAGELASAAARPITDLRASKEYRLELIKVLTRRVLEKAAARAGRSQ